MTSFMNVALFDQRGELERLVSGTKDQVELNISEHPGKWAEMPLLLNRLADVPPFEDLEAEGRLNG